MNRHMNFLNEFINSSKSTTLSYGLLYTLRITLILISTINGRETNNLPDHHVSFGKHWVDSTDRYLT